MAMTKVSMKRCLVGMLHEILFEIFRRLPKGKLYEISDICSQFRIVAGDIRLWKDVYIKYEPETFAFEELYSKPWPVNVIDLSYTKIKPPLLSKIYQEVARVKKLDLSSISTDIVTINAILTKYQCTELCLDPLMTDRHYRITQVLPETFPQHTALKVFSLGRYILTEIGDRVWRRTSPNFPYIELLDLIEYLPRSLEKLFLAECYFCEDSFFESLAKKIPNLKELGCLWVTEVEYPSLLKFQFLEDLHIIAHNCDDILSLLMYLIKFPALKNINVELSTFYDDPETQLKLLQKNFKPYDITVRRAKKPSKKPNHPIVQWDISPRSGPEIDQQ